MSCVAVVDIGTNSTRMLVAEVDGRAIRELQRESIVTRLGEGVEATGRLGEAPQRRVFAALDRFAAAIAAHGAATRTVVMTSAVRDAANGAEFAEIVRERYGLEGPTLSGDDEARLSFLGATATRDPEDPTPLLVIDIGGGSTELVVGARGTVEFHTSTQVGVVRHTERHLRSDPPGAGELEALAADARAAIQGAVPADVRERAGGAVAVAGTATSCAAIDLALDPYDSAAVEGHPLSRATLEAMLARLAAMTLAERRGVTGLDPARGPTIVAGVIVLLEVQRAFGLDRVAVSERDLLWGVALASTNRR
jgi:exopolyphosphatase / guanosine-5'-triphosphate,3'-diphosphate pyrophosphatase